MLDPVIISIVTFDQPLYMRAQDLVHSQQGDTHLSNIVLRLGGFHLLMLFLGVVGYVMDGSGLKELWQTVYAPNTTEHMMSGHQYARSLRAHLLSQTALGMLILNEMSLSPEVCEEVKDKIFARLEADPPTNEEINSSELITMTVETFNKELERLEGNGALDSIL